MSIVLGPENYSMPSRAEVSQSEPRDGTSSMLMIFCSGAGPVFSDLNITVSAVTWYEPGKLVDKKNELESGHLGCQYVSQGKSLLEVFSHTSCNIFKLTLTFKNLQNLRDTKGKVSEFNH